jgi:drug/metabolite transporter (DMT)-like permease
MTNGAKGGAARAALFVIFAGTAFSIASPLARWARPTDPLLVALGRLIVAALVLVAADARGIGAAVRGLSWRQRGTVALAGGILALHFACFLWGLDHTSLPAAVSLVSLEPVSVVLCAWILLGVAPTRQEQLGVALATAGAVVVGRGSGTGEHRLVGDVVVLAAVALYGLYLAVARALRDALPARSYVALVYATSVPAMAVLYALAAVVAPRPTREPVGLHAFVAIVGLGLVPTVLGHTAVQTASRSLAPAVVALVSPLETLGGIAIGAAWMNASPSRDELVGAAIILAGTVVAILAPRRAPSSAAPSASSS